MLREAFQQHIQERFSFLLGKPLLLAVSGGLDSMVLAHLCTSLQLDSTIAHCNFKLRGEESDGDAQSVQTWANQHGIPILIKDFDTTAYAKKHKLSTQMAARKLRYDWFYELLTERNLDYILTAHHANDTLETSLINWSRGTGLKGLAGIPEQHEKVVRPLLPFSRKQLQEYATQEKLIWREDSSNASDYYLRNALRHHVIPQFEKEVPHLLANTLKTQQHLKQAQQLLDVYKEQLKTELIYPINQLLGPTLWCIDLEKLNVHAAPEAVLYVLLDEYGFTSWDDVYALRSAQTGKQVFSQTHVLLKDRETLQLYEIDQSKNVEHYQIPEGMQELHTHFGNFVFEAVDELGSVNHTTVYIAYEALKFPLAIRKWEAGDMFYPLGMQGKKKISKFLKDEKVSLSIKSNVWVLCSGDMIVWVIGYRADNRFKVRKTTQQLLKITFSTDEQ